MFRTAERSLNIACMIARCPYFTKLKAKSKIPYILTIRKRLSLDVDKRNTLKKPSLLNSTTSMTSLTLN